MRQRLWLLRGTATFPLPCSSRAVSAEGPAILCLHATVTVMDAAPVRSLVCFYEDLSSWKEPLTLIKRLLKSR